MRRQEKTPGPIPLLASLLVAGAAAAQEPVAVTFQPAPGTVLRKTWLTTHDLLSEAQSRTVNGTLMVGIRMGLKSESTLEVVDEFGESAGGRPLGLRRTYRVARLKGAMVALGQDAPGKEVKLGSGLTRHSVVFTWVPGEQAYGRYYDAAEADEGWLPDLTEDMDFRALLPAGPVAVGQRWELDAMDLRDVLAPGGDLQLDTKERVDRMFTRTLGSGIGGGLHQAFNGSAAGDVTATLEKLEGGTAVIALRLEGVRYLSNLTRYFKERRAPREEDSSIQAESGELLLELDGEGRLVWDLEAGHARSFELNLAEKITGRAGQRSGKVTIEDELRLSGKMHMMAEFGPGEAKPAPGPRAEGAEDGQPAK